MYLYEAYMHTVYMYIQMYALITESYMYLRDNLASLKV